MFESACVAVDGIEMKCKSLSASFSVCCLYTGFVCYNLIFFPNKLHCSGFLSISVSYAL